MRACRKSRRGPTSFVQASSSTSWHWKKSQLLKPGSFASIPHDVNQPLSDAIRTGLGNVFAATPILQPRTAFAYQIARDFASLLPVDDMSHGFDNLLSSFSGVLPEIVGHPS